MDMNDTLLPQVSVIGSMLIDERCIGPTLAQLRPDDFQTETYRKVFLAIRKLFTAGTPVDPVTVLDALKGDIAVDWCEVLKQCMIETPTAANVGVYVPILREQARLARIQVLAGELMGVRDLDSAQDCITIAGVVNLFSGAIYGLGGQNGIAGLAGGGPRDNPESLVFEGATYPGGKKGKDVDGYVAGVAYGGWGGGPAAGTPGGDGSNGSTRSNNGYGLNYGGAGGQGATPLARDPATGFGQGGDAGHGGGGGGGGGPATGPENRVWQGDGGSGGQGGQGGKGGPGCIILYF